MKKLSLLFIGILIALTNHAQDEIKLTTEVKEVKVFLKGANVTRTGIASLKTGKNKILLEKLPKEIDVSTIKLKLNGNTTIKNISHNINFLDLKQKGSLGTALQEQIDSVKLEIEETKMELGMVQDKINLIVKNQNLSQNKKQSVGSDLLEMLKLYEEEFSRLRKSELAWKRKLRTDEKLVTTLVQQLRVTDQIKAEPSLEVVVDIDSQNAFDATLSLSYFTKHASWFPVYDARVKSVSQDLSLNLKAQIIQTTSEEWKDVKVTLSNVIPDASGQLPELEKWKLTYSRWTDIKRKDQRYDTNRSGRIVGFVIDEDGSPLIGATIIVKGTTIGAVTDIDGAYDLAVPNSAKHISITYIGYESRELSIATLPVRTVLSESVHMLDEIVVTGYSLQGKVAGITSKAIRSFERKEKVNAPVKAEIIEKQNAINYEIEDVQTLKNNGKPKMVDIKDYDLGTIYEYHAAPKLKSDVYIVAKIPNWDQYHFLQGEMNLYFEDSYVGKSVLESNSFEDTLSLSLGIDYNVKVKREESESLSKKTFLGTNRIDTRSYILIVNNQKSVSIEINLYDQIPVSIIKDVVVTFENPDNAELDQEAGKLNWKLEIPPLDKSAVNFGYVVRYPKREKVILE